MHVVPVHGETHPYRAVMAEDQLQVGWFAENAHIREHAVVHKMMRAHTVAAKLLAHKLVAPLRFFDFADYRSDEHVALKLYSGTFERLHGVRVTDQRTLHIVNAQPVDQAVSDDGLRLVAVAGEEFFAAGIGSVHVAVEHQAFAVPHAFPESHHIRAAFFDFLPGDGEPRFFQRASHVAAHFQLFPGGTGNVDHVAAHRHELIFANLRQDGFGQIFLHGIRFPSR